MKFNRFLPKLGTRTAIAAMAGSLFLLLAIGLSSVMLKESILSSAFSSAQIGAIEEAGGDAGNGQKKSSTLKRIVVAPVRLFAKLFRHDDNQTASRKPASPVAAGTESDALSVATAIERQAATLFDQAVDLHDKKQLEDSIAKLVAVVAMQPRHSEAYNLLGVCYDEKGQYLEAQKQYRKAIQLEPVNSRFLNNLGYSFYLSEDDKQAIKFYQKALRLTPGDKRLLNNLGLAYGRKGEFVKAREQFELAVGETGAYLNMGFVYNQHGQYQRAIDQFEQALKHDPNSMVALSSLAQIYDRVGRVRESQMLTAQYRRLAGDPLMRGSQTAERKDDQQDKDDR